MRILIKSFANSKATYIEYKNVVAIIIDNGQAHIQFTLAANKYLLVRDSDVISILAD